VPHFSFLDLLRAGDIPPITFGTARPRVLELLGTPTSSGSGDDPLFAPPKRDYRTSDSFDYGSIMFSFDTRDELDGILIYLGGAEISYPKGFLFFPGHDTRVADVADLMRSYDIPFTDISPKGDGTELRTGSGVVIARGYREPDRDLDLVLHVQSFRKGRGESRR